MTPDRAPDWDVSARDIPRDLFPSGRVRFSLATTSAREIRRRRAALQVLRDRGEWQVIHAVSVGLVSVAELERRIRTHGEAAIPELRSDAEARAVGETPTFGSEASDYLEWYERRRGEGSLRNVRSRLKRLGEQLVGPRDGQRPLSAVPMTEITSMDAEAAIEAVSSRPGTMFNLKAAGSGLFTWSARREAEQARVKKRTPRWTENPFSLVEVPERKSRPEVCSRDQVRDLLAASQLYQMAYLRALVQVGMRIMELAHLRFHTDFDPETWVVRIQPRGPDPRCGCDQCQGSGWSPKTGTGERTFRVPESQAELRDAVTAYLQAYPCEPGDFVFRNPNTGGVWSDTTLRRDFMALCEKAGVRYGREEPGGITLHTLRHTAITELVRAGVRESVIAALVGDTLDSVMIYVHLNEHDLGDGLGRAPRYE